jgi:hypothetical protein
MDGRTWADIKPPGDLRVCAACGTSIASQSVAPRVMPWDGNYVWDGYVRDPTVRSSDIVPIVPMPSNPDITDHLTLHSDGT